MASHHRDRRSVDLLIVGGSFAGLVAARTAAMRGLSVMVIEAKREVGARVATTGILVKEAAEEIDVPHRLTRRINGVRLYGPSLHHIDLFAPGYFFLTTDTANLLRWLASEAERAGARILTGVRFTGAARAVAGEDFEIAGMPDGLPRRARYILGADGARSAVAKAFGLGRNTAFLTGIEAEYENLAGIDPRFLHCFLDSRIAPGYLGWVAPGPAVTQVGLAVTGGAPARLDRFLARTAGLFGYGNARLVERRAGRIPAGGLVRPWASPGVMLIGDAAGMVSPATGGGIRLAFHFGKRAGHAIADHLQALGPSPDIALAPSLPAFNVKRAMRALLDVPLPNVALDAALRTAPMRWLATRVYFHRRGAGGLTFAEFDARLRAIGDRGTETPRGGDAVDRPT
ncbi:MAG: NAD(P)/FAD-dependent oxidoreductase [Hyphomicrobiaceae bacterium]|nr:NAD(P)/FAD-dependent oxidoreductase [Hyphomicrobiaceae bacterium]